MSAIVTWAGAGALLAALCLVALALLHAAGHPQPPWWAPVLWLALVALAAVGVIKVLVSLL